MKKLVVGVLLLLVGVFLVFNNLGLVDSTVYHWIISWQSLLIAIGLILLFDDRTSNKEGGAILIVIGLLFLLPRVFDLPGIRHFILPAVIIGVGFMFLIKSTRKKKEEDSFSSFSNDFKEEWREEWQKEAGQYFSSVNGDNYSEKKSGGKGLIKREYLFSGAKEKWTYNKVKKVDIEAFFSGVVIDLSQIEFDEEVKTIHIKVISVFSGVTLYIPSDWYSIVQKTGVFGGFTDRRPPYVNMDSSGQTVILEVEAMFGGGEIRYYE